MYVPCTCNLYKPSRWETLPILYFTREKLRCQLELLMRLKPMTWRIFCNYAQFNIFWHWICVWFIIGYIVMCLTKTNSKWQMSKISLSEGSKYIYNITWSHHEKHVYVHMDTWYINVNIYIYYVCIVYCIIWILYIIEYVSK